MEATECNLGECNLETCHKYYLAHLASRIGDVLTNSDFNHLCQMFNITEIDYHNPYDFGSPKWFEHNTQLKITIETINQLFTQMFQNIINYLRTQYPSSNLASIYDDFENQLSISFDSENNFTLDLIVH
jgi:hypothetical protein